jgi:catechol 2,3-dioxygenase-like lactoylglutathione lyase family enzyme
MLDHVSLSVTDPVRSQTFYAQALAPLGYKVISQFDGGFGIGAEGGSAIWAAAGAAQKPIAHLALERRIASR